MKYIFILLIVFIVLAGCIENEKAINSTNMDIIKICVEGHIYYYVGQGYINGGLAIKLDDNGKPVPCENKEGK